MIYRRVLCLLLTFACSQTVLAENDFAEWLYENQFYDRAITEYLRVIAQPEEDSEFDLATINIATCYYQKHEYRNAINWINRNSVLQQSSFSSYTTIYCLSLMALDEFAAAEKRLIQSRVKWDTDKIGQLHFYTGYSQIMQLKPKTAQQSWKLIPQESSFYLRSSELLEKINETRLPNFKNPVLAASLATVPGLGYAYVGHKQTALSATIVLGILGLATYKSQLAENDGLTAFTGFVTVGWYLGSLYGSYKAADRINKFKVEKYRDHFN